MERAVIYCRVSSKEQVDNFSLATQEKACRDYCEKNGIAVDTVFIEEGESAKTADRHKFIEMLDYCKKSKGKIGYLVVYQISRFARQSCDHHTVRAMLLKDGIKFRSVTEPIDDSATGKLMEGVLASFAQFDNDLRSDRTIVGMTEAAKSGRWVHQAPIGYLTGGKGQPSLKADPERAQYVLKAFELFATQRYSKRQIVDKINVLGFKTKKGGKLNPQTFGRMLRNPIYMGRVVLPKFQTDKKGDFEAIVPKELYFQVQNILDGNTGHNVPHYRNNKDFPLRRFTRCDKCGTPLTGSWSTGRNKKYSYYHCRNNKCLAVNIRRENMEQLFIEKIDEIMPNEAYMGVFKEIVRDVYRERLSEGLEERNGLVKRIRTLKDRISKLIDMRMDGEIDLTTFSEKRNEIQVEVEQAEKELSKADSGTMDIDSALEFAERVVMNAGKLWQSLEFDDRIKLQNLLFTDGLSFDGEKFGTIKTNSIFSMLTENAACYEQLATPAGIEPASPA